MSKPNVFIIETLKFDDEKNDRYEGKVLSNILKLNEIESEYYYLRTKKELIAVINRFKESNFRYLHISCHGSSSELATTLDTISFSELGDLLTPTLTEKRLFLSACKMVNENFAKAIIPKSKCYSIIGPSTPIAFSDAAIFWSSFYHLMYTKNNRSMKRDDIKDVLENITKLFEVNINYYSISKAKGIKKIKYPL